MKERIIFLLAISFLLAGCAMAPVNHEPADITQAAAAEEKAPRLLTPDDLVGRLFKGECDEGSFTYRFHGNGTFEYTVNGTACHGVWAYRQSDALQFIFHWMEGGREHGYVVTATDDGEVITFAGNWYLTGAKKPFMRQVREAG
jgi:hypothetical protein